MSDLVAVAARLREATLAAWADNPVRFREDANAEEDHAVGWYRDRVVVELAQNAADAASASGPGGGRLRLSLDTHRRRLVAVNTGAPLDGTGLTSLASLRASAKRPGAGVGRFGVGFAAVRSVSDEIGVVSSGGSVCFSVARTAEALATLELGSQISRRGSALPVLRLPFDGSGPAQDDVLTGGWDTAVVLALRDDAAVAVVRDQLGDLDDALLLALPALASVEVEIDGNTRTLTSVADRWLVVTSEGELPAELMADRPVEEREHAGWRLTWAVPRDAPSEPSAVHAPTVTDDATTLRALLIGTFPLDPGRRRITPGPVTDALVAEAGKLWSELLTACRRAVQDGETAPDALDLIPTGFPAGRLDSALRQAVLEATRETAVLLGSHGPVAPQDAIVLRAPWDVGPASAVLGPWFGELVTVPPRHREVLRALDVTTVGLAELVEQVPATDPGALRAVYALVEGAGTDLLDEIATVPVPLVDGRVVHGARGAVVLDVEAGLPLTDSVRALASWGLRVVHPDASHPVLVRLGAQVGDAAALATHPVLRDRVLDGDDAATEVLLDLVTRTPTMNGPSWWSEAVLPAQDGELLPARGLVMPGSAAESWFAPDVLAPVADRMVQRWGDTLSRIGVRAGLVVEPVDELVADAIEDWGEYVEQTGAVDDGSLLAVVDLDAVRTWPPVLAEIATRPELVEPVPGDDGGLVPSYVVWRLRDDPEICDGPFALPGSGATAPSYLPAVPAALTQVSGPGAEGLLRALGGVRVAEDLSADDWWSLLESWDVGDVLPLDLAVDCWRAVAAAGADPGVFGEIEVLPGWDGTRAVLTEVEALAVADPMWRRHPGAWPVLPVPFGTVVAEALDLEQADRRARGNLSAGGVRRAVPEAVTRVVRGGPSHYQHHDELVVDGHPLAWWVTDGPEPVVHATPKGLAEGIAAAVGWAHRHRIAAVLADPHQVDAALLDQVDDPL